VGVDLLEHARYNLRNQRIQTEIYIVINSKEANTNNYLYVGPIFCAMSLMSWT